MTCRSSLLAAASTALVLTLAADAGAATINVTTTADAIGQSGCSLREAVEAANDNSTGPGSDCVQGEASPIVDTIMVPADALPYQLTLTGAKENDGLTGDLDIDSDVLIQGAGAGSTVINGNGTDRVFDLVSGASELRGLTVTNGSTPDGAAGGAVPNAPAGGSSTGNPGGDVDGAGTTKGDGGGIRSSSTSVLTLTEVTVSGNRTGAGGIAGTAGAGGAGVAGQGGFSTGGDGGNGGNGGGVASEGGGLEIVDSLIAGNTAGDGGRGGNGAAGGEGAAGFGGGFSEGGFGGFGGNGGGVYQESGPVAITHSTISANHAGAGGRGGDGAAAGDGGDNPGLAGGNGNNSFGGGGGGGGYSGGVDVEAGSALALTDSTITGNHAGGGGRGGDAGAGGDGGSGATSGAGGTSGGSSGGSAGGSGGLQSFAQSTTITRSAVIGNESGGGGTGGNAGTGGAGASGGDTEGGNGADGGEAAGLGVGGSGGSITNSTIAGNSAGNGGGGGAAGIGPGTDTPGEGGKGGGDGALEIRSFAGAFDLTHITLAFNEVGAGGSGTPVGTAGTVGGLRNKSTSLPTLRSSIVAKNDGAQCSGTITDGSHNVEFPGSGHCAGSAINADPLLSALGPHGGPTPTMLPGLGSPAIDAAGTGAPCPATDQRGVGRPKGPACDSGAVERSAPGVATGAASAIAARTANVGGTVNPRGFASTYRFEFGTTKAYGRKTAPVGAGSGGAPVPASASLTGLAPGTRFHYRLTAQNSDGAAVGADRTFTTKPLAFPGVAIVNKAARLDGQRRAPIVLRCPVRTFTKNLCKGTLTLTAPRGTTTLTLGTASFKILAGRTATRKVKVSQQGAQLIAAAGKLKATARTSARDARNGAPVVKSAPVTLKPPKAARLIARR